MTQELTWGAVSAQAFTSNGTSAGVVTVADSSLFKRGQIVDLSSATQGARFLVLNVTSPTTLVLGSDRKSVTANKVADLSLYLVAETAEIKAPKQERYQLGGDDVLRRVYAEEPTVALRSTLVDKHGQGIDTNNPLPVDASVSVGDVHVQLTHLDDDPTLGDIHDSIRLGDGTNEVTTDVYDNETQVGLHTIELTGTVDVPWDNMAVTSTNAKGDPLIIEYKDNAVLVRTLTFTYDAKGNVATIQKS